MKINGSDLLQNIIKVTILLYDGHMPIQNGMEGKEQLRHLADNIGEFI